MTGASSGSMYLGSSLRPPPSTMSFSIILHTHFQYKVEIDSEPRQKDDETFRKSSLAEARRSVVKIPGEERTEENKDTFDMVAQPVPPEEEHTGKKKKKKSKRKKKKRGKKNQQKIDDQGSDISAEMDTEINKSPSIIEQEAKEHEEKNDKKNQTTTVGQDNTTLSMVIGRSNGSSVISNHGFCSFMMVRIFIIIDGT